VKIYRLLLPGTDMSKVYNSLYVESGLVTWAHACVMLAYWRKQGYKDVKIIDTSIKEK